MIVRKFSNSVICYCETGFQIHADLATYECKPPKWNQPGIEVL